MNLSVAIVHNQYGKHSGEETVVENLTALLIKRGVVVYRFSRTSAEIEGGLPGKMAAFFSGIHNAFAKREFEKFLKEKRPEVVHIHNLYPLISPSILPVCRKLGIPVVMTVHNFRLVCPNGLLMSGGEICHRCLSGREYWCILRNCEDSIFKSTGYALRTVATRMLKRYLDNVSHFICLSEFQKNILVKEGLPANLVSVMANPLSLNVKSSPITLYKRGDVSFMKEGNGYVAYVGRLSPEKDIYTLLDASRMLSDIPFKFAGDYHRMPEVLKSKPANCVFLGQLNSEEIASFYADARLVVFATRCYEGFPSVLLEAMSHGLPIICSRIGGLPEIVEDNVTGLLYEPGKASELAARIQMLWQNANLCARLGEEGRKKLRLKYDSGQLMDGLMEIYEKVIKAKDTFD